MIIDWTEYDSQDKKSTTPDTECLVWVWEAGYQGDPGVSLGYFDGFTWRMWWGTDDCNVTHWAQMNYPTNSPPDGNRG